MIEVDGQRAAATNLGCAPPYTAVVPCKLAASGTVALDTAALADGAHTVRVLVTDVSGNSAALRPVLDHDLQRAHELRGHGRPEPDHDPQPSQRHDLLRRPAPVHGQLAGAPAGTQVRMFSQVSRAGAPQNMARTPLVTDAEGRFTYRVPAGPSRTLRFAYRSAGDPLFACSKAVSVKVRAPVSLRATPRAIRPGQRVRFRGRLRGGYVPAVGQARRAAGLRAQPLAQPAQRPHQRARRVQLSLPLLLPGVGHDVPGPRARAADAGYPWAVGTSNRVRVRVR